MNKVFKFGYLSSVGLLVSFNVDRPFCPTSGKDP